MTKLMTTAVVALMLMVLAIVPASAATSVEIRSSVLTGSGSLDATTFAGFFYDLDDNISTETMNITVTNGTRSIAADALTYTTTIRAVEYASNNLNTSDNPEYNVMGLFAEKYIPLADDTPDKLSKLLLDADQKYTVRTGTALQLPGGYALTAKQIDVEGNKVWMEFSKDGEFIEDEILDVSNGTVVWTYEADDIAGEDDVVVMRVAVTNVFQGQVDSLAVIDGVWLMDYENVLEIETEDKFDKLEVTGIDDNSLTLQNTNAITLTRDKTISIAQGMSFKVADDSALRYYVMKVFTAPGTYEIRGEVVEGVGSQTWTAENFAGFYYDLNDNISTETMTVNVTSPRSIAADALTYTTTIRAVEYASNNLNTSDNPEYNVMGLFAEKYVPLANDTPDKLSKLLLDADQKYTLRTGTALQLPGGYALTAKQIDVDGNKVWMEFSKDGEFIEDEILDVSNGTVVWTYEADDIAGEDDVVVMRVAVTNVFQGQVDSLAVIDGVWLMDYENVLEIETEDKFDKLEVTGIDDSSLTLQNTNAITLTRDKTIAIAQGMNFRVADDSALRYYPFATVTIEGEQVTQPDQPDVETPGNETPTTETPTNETPTTETPGTETPTNDTTPEQESPGFEAVFAVAGLLAVAYLVRRN